MSNKYYKITDWKGLDNYECLHCAFATLDKRQINLHVDVHVRAGLEPVEPAKEVEKKHTDANYGLGKPKSKPAKGKEKKEKLNG